MVPALRSAPESRPATQLRTSRYDTPVLLSAPGLSVMSLVLFVLFGWLVAPALLQIAAELGPHDL